MVIRRCSKDEKILNVINLLIDWEVEEILSDSKTYEDALQKTKRSSLAYEQGTLGEEIDKLLINKIIKTALQQKIK